MAISLTSVRLFRFHFVSRVLYGWAGFQSVLLLAFSKYFVFMKESLVKERTTFNSLSGVTYGHTQRKSANNLWGVRCYYYIFFFVLVVLQCVMLLWPSRLNFVYSFSFFSLKERGSAEQPRAGSRLCHGWSIPPAQFGNIRPNGSSLPARNSLRRRIFRPGAANIAAYLHLAGIHQRPSPAPVVILGPGGRIRLLWRRRRQKSLQSTF